jgi:6,7-dimethyl-8-ribityllumazine synthase
MARTIEGKLDAKGGRFAIVIGRFNSFISNRLLAGAMDALERNGAAPDDITVVWVPGSFEIPLTARKMALSKNYDAVICLGVLIRGETPHFDHIAPVVARGVGAAGSETGVPVIFGVLTCNTMEQAAERAGLKSGNRGFDAAMSAIEMYQLLKQL